MMTLALGGNPNCGKTTLFNALTGSRQHVGNWPGVTVEKKEGTATLGGHDVAVVDLPGIYGLSASSQDETVSRDYLLSREAACLVNVVDASNLERNLYLSLQLMETGIPVVMVLTKLDLAARRGISVDTGALARALGIPVLGINATSKADLKTFRDFLAAELPRAKAAPVHPYQEAQEALIAQLCGARGPEGQDPRTRWAAIRLLERDEAVWGWPKAGLGSGVAGDAAVSLPLAEALRLCREAEAAWGDESDIIIADQKYALIERVSTAALTRAAPRRSMSDRLDAVFLNRFLGIPLFLGAMYLVFFVTIGFGGAFIDFFDLAFGAVFVDGLGLLLEGLGSPGWLTTFLASGVGAGIQTVATFVPIIFMMFFMLAILEDSGYMARAAFVMDRLMRRIGLPGKAFVPMLVGLGCTIPAIMATRTLDSREDRLTTIFMAPLISCGARLPVYALFGAALFGPLAGVVVFSLYVVGLGVSILTGLLMRKTMFKGAASHFVMELPPYHLPRPGRILANAGNRLWTFVKRAGVAITSVVVVLGLLNTIGIDDKGLSFGNEDSEISVLAHVGKAVTPVFGPMGISEENWPATVGLFTGLFAKEAVVGTLNSLYAVAEADEVATPAAVADGIGSDALDGSEEAWSLGAALGEAVASIPEALSGLGGTFLDPLGLGLIGQDVESTAQDLEAGTATFALMRQRFSNPAAFAYLLFVLIYFPCVAALGTAIQEMGALLGWVQAAYLTLVAWAVATLWYQISFAGNLGWILVALGILGGLVFFFARRGPWLLALAERRGPVVTPPGGAV